MSSNLKRCNLVVVAHPDDETLFFGGLVLAEQFANRRTEWRILCVTDGNADGHGKERHEQFVRACRLLGVRKFEFFDFQDRYESRLNQNELQSRLIGFRNRLAGERCAIQNVYTHGPLGEYGHPHHQDVSLAVHEAFHQHRGKAENVWGVAYNCHPDRVIKLSQVQFKKKAKILADIYLGETSRFIQYLPATSVEGFARFKLAEVRALHAFLSAGAELKSLDKYKWFIPYLPAFRQALLARPF